MFGVSPCTLRTRFVLLTLVLPKCTPKALSLTTYGPSVPCSESTKISTLECDWLVAYVSIGNSTQSSLMHKKWGSSFFCTHPNGPRTPDFPAPAPLFAFVALQRLLSLTSINTSLEWRPVLSFPYSPHRKCRLPLPVLQVPPFLCRRIP